MDLLRAGDVQRRKSKVKIGDCDYDLLEPSIMQVVEIVRLIGPLRGGDFHPPAFSSLELKKYLATKQGMKNLVRIIRILIPSIHGGTIIEDEVADPEAIILKAVELYSLDEKPEIPNANEKPSEKEDIAVRIAQVAMKWCMDPEEFCRRYTFRQLQIMGEAAAKGVNDLLKIVESVLGKGEKETKMIDPKAPEDAAKALKATHPWIRLKTKGKKNG